MQVRVVSKSGEERVGTARFSPDRSKKRSVYVVFDSPLPIPDWGPSGSHMTAGEEFYLLEQKEARFSRMIWGQGMEFPADDWSLHPDDAKAIIAGGGG